MHNERCIDLWTNIFADISLLKQCEMTTPNNNYEAC